MFPISRRRRNVLLACGAVAAGGYVTYRIYSSRKRLRVFLFFESFSTLLDVLSRGSNTFAVVLSDLHGFVASEEDEVPQSIKQLLKIVGSSEAQESISAVSAALSRGLLSAFTSSGSSATSLKHEELPRKLQSTQTRVLTPRGRPRVSEETKNVIKWDEKENRALQKRASTSHDDRTLSPDDGKGVEEFSRESDRVLDVDAWTGAGNMFDGVKAQFDSSIARGTKEALQEGLGVDRNPNGNGVGTHSGIENSKDHLVDRLTEKLFSESGKGFASAVVASASRSFVTSVLEHMNTPNRDGRSESGGELVKGLATFARTTDGRAVLTDCIQTFVGTAVSVYLERTKDINTFDELAASLSNPEHQAPITDLLTSICEASTRSFVRTSHEVLISDPSSSTTESKQTSAAKATVSCPDFGELFHDNEGSEVFYDMGEHEPISPSHSLVKWKGKTIVGKKESPTPSNYVEQISKVIAVPSNRKLILDIAGAVTSSGVRSMIDVSLGKISAAFSCGSNAEEPASKDQGYEAPRRSGVGEKLQTVGDATKAVMDKSVVLMTMCFAVCLHSVVGGVRMVQPF